MVVFRNRAGILVAENLSDAFLDELEGLPVTTGRQRIVMFPVALDGFRVPVAEPNAVDEVFAYPVAFNRKRVICIGDIYIVHVAKICLRVCGTAGGLWG